MKNEDRKIGRFFVCGSITVAIIWFYIVWGVVLYLPALKAVPDDYLMPVAGAEKFFGIDGSKENSSYLKDFRRELTEAMNEIGNNCEMNSDYAVIFVREESFYQERLIAVYVVRDGSNQLIWCIEKKRLRTVAAIKKLAGEAAQVICYSLSEIFPPKKPSPGGVKMNI